ncbi:nitrogen fixation/metabolism regulation signal transduction histidine kinase [Bacillus mesophilus]|nr:nitrogen fixation/metabolism regulation signal transduction histidine kinase [Bacillus mesophilus]
MQIVDNLFKMKFIVTISFVNFIFFYFIQQNLNFGIYWGAFIIVPSILSLILSVLIGFLLYLVHKKRLNKTKYFILIAEIIITVVVMIELYEILTFILFFES